MTAVSIKGSGVAACCCARLLQNDDFSVDFLPRPSVQGPVLLLNRSTQKLVHDVFGCGDTLLAYQPQIRQRTVLWGDQPAMTIPHCGTVVEERVLLERMANSIQVKPSENRAPDWTILAAPTSAVGAALDFGTREAEVVTVCLKQTNSESCWIESVKNGWLFLLPHEDGRASLTAVGGSYLDLLQQSRLISAQITNCDGSPHKSLKAYPRIQKSLCGPGWLACGTAAMSFDPICGEGLGNAVREAILASAVMAASQRFEIHDLLSFYSSRLLIGFLRHLEGCRKFYEAARCGDWWDRQLQSLDEAIAWTRGALAKLRPGHFRLVDFALERAS